jgi:hypothetical protein
VQYKREYCQNTTKQKTFHPQIKISMESALKLVSRAGIAAVGAGIFNEFCLYDGTSSKYLKIIF